MADATFGGPREWVQMANAEGDEDELIGDIGLCIGATEPPHAEIGFSLHPRRQRRGLASEAVSLLLGWPSGDAGLDHVQARCDERNSASLRLLARVGTVRVGTEESVFKGETRTEILFIRPRPH